MTKKAKPTQETLSLRLDSDVVKRLDRVRINHAKLFENYGPLIQYQETYSRAFVLRTAINLGLDFIEAKTKELAAEEKNRA